MQIKATDIRKGMVIKYEGDPWSVMGMQHVAPGNWRAMVQTKLRNLKTGSNSEIRFSSTDKLETIHMEQRDSEFLYDNGDALVFMNLETCEEITLHKDVLGDAVLYLLPNTPVKVNYLDKEIVGIDLPINVDLVVTDCEPGLKSATVTNVYKAAKMETGLTVQVPPFVNKGEKIRVDTRTGEYVERVKS